MLLTTTVYCFDPATGFYTGEQQASENPMNIGNDDFLMPANSATVKPPSAGALTPRWNGTSWELVDAISTQAAIDVRTHRNMRLAACDWTQLPDVPEWVDVQAWREYRQALRDVPQQGGFPLNVNWPDVPVRS